MDESAAVLAEFEEGLLWAIISVVVVWSGWVEGGDEEEVNWSFCIWRTVCNIWVIPSNFLSTWLIWKKKCENCLDVEHCKSSLKDLWFHILRHIYLIFQSIQSCTNSHRFDVALLINTMVVVSRFTKGLIKSSL